MKLRRSMDMVRMSSSDMRWATSRAEGTLNGICLSCSKSSSRSRGLKINSSRHARTVFADEGYSVEEHLQHQIARDRSVKLELLARVRQWVFRHRIRSVVRLGENLQQLLDRITRTKRPKSSHMTSFTRSLSPVGPASSGSSRTVRLVS